MSLREADSTRRQPMSLLSEIFRFLFGIKEKSQSAVVEVPVIEKTPEEPAKMPIDEIRDVGAQDQGRVKISGLAPSQKCIDLCAHFETFFPRAYICPGGKLTIGYGHTNEAGSPKFTKDSVWTEQFAAEVLAHEIGGCAVFVRRYISVDLFQHEFDALVSFTMNLGPGSLSRSTLRKLINSGKYEMASGELQKWNKAGGKVLNGLVRRRKSEGYLFDTGGLKFFDE